MEKGNLIEKLEILFNSCILCDWKDSIITLQKTKALLPWSEDLDIVHWWINAIACKAMVDPSKVKWSYNHSRGQTYYNTLESVSSPSLSELHSWRCYFTPKYWWVEDIDELKIGLYWRVMLAIKSNGKFFFFCIWLEKHCECKLLVVTGYVQGKIQGWNRKMKCNEQF